MIVPEASNGDLLIEGADNTYLVFDRKLGDEIHNQVVAALERKNAGGDGGEFSRLVERYEEGAQYAKWRLEQLKSRQLDGS